MCIRDTKHSEGNSDDVVFVVLLCQLPNLWYCILCTQVFAKVIFFGHFGIWLFSCQNYDNRSFFLRARMRAKQQETFSTLLSTPPHLPSASDFASSWGCCQGPHPNKIKETNSKPKLDEAWAMFEILVFNSVGLFKTTHDTSWFSYQFCTPFYPWQ